MTDYTDLLTTIATRVFENRASEIPPLTTDAYPDCYDSCTDVIEQLDEQTSIPVQSSSISELVLGDEYRHYVAVIQTETGGTYVVDPTFGQFSNEYRSPVNVGCVSVVSHAVAVPKNEYVFNHKLETRSSRQF